MGRALTAPLPHFDITNFPEQEKRMITRQQITKGLRWILDHPCTDPRCKCRYHDVLPEIDELMWLRQLRDRDGRCTPRNH